MPRVTTRNPRRLTGTLTNRLGILSLLMVGIIPLVSAQSYAPTKGPDLLSTLIAVLTIGMCTSSVNPTLRAIHNFYTRPEPICQICHELGHFALDCEDMRHSRLSGHGNTLWDQRCIATSRLDRLSTCKRKRNAKTNQWPKKNRSAAMSQLRIPISRAMTHLEIEMYKESGINQNSPLTTTQRLHLQRMAEPSNEDIMATCNSLADEYVQQIVAEAKRPATNRGAKGRPKQGPAVQPGPLVKTAPVKRVTIRPKPQAQPETNSAPARQAVEPQSAPPIQARQVTTRQPDVAQEAPTRKATNPKPPVAPRKIAPQPAKRPRSPTPESDYEPEEEEQEEYYEEEELAEPEEIPSPPRRKILKGVVSRKQDSPQKERSPTPQRPHQRGRSTKRESSTPPRRHRARSTQREKSPRRHERARSKSESPHAATTEPDQWHLTQALKMIPGLERTPRVTMCMQAEKTHHHLPDNNRPMEYGSLDGMAAHYVALLRPYWKSLERNRERKILKCQGIRFPFGLKLLKPLYFKQIFFHQPRKESDYKEIYCNR
ncbi:hypothetical protein DdX_20129 [Ditylenchus destructor]|uniref:Uncharacterized protein n=1 Tax=Ditylenchus destructor TaxID=166010 RepID=A0AAD4QTT0_9BILA|nr:hypothetical protein DdX_20129 [Ditylenchus destructor]